MTYKNLAAACTNFCFLFLHFVLEIKSKLALIENIHGDWQLNLAVKEIVLL